MADLADGFDPSIALHVTGAGAPPAALNPIEMIGGLANARNALNANQLFQQQQAARYKLGRIMATAASPADGLKLAGQDPEISSLIPEAISSLQSSATSDLSRQQTTQTMGLEGMKSISQAEGGAAGDPALFNPIADSIQSVLSPAANPMVSRGREFIRKAVNADPAHASQILSAISVGAGMSPDSLRNLQGEPGVGVSTQSMGPGGAPVLVQTGGPVGAQPTAQVLGSSGNDANGAPMTAPLTGQTPQQIAIQSSEGANAGTIEQDMNEAAQTLPNAMNRLDTVKNTLSGFLSGGGADTMANFAKGLQAVRDRVPGMESLIPESTIDKVGNGNLGDAQLFKETIIPTMAAVLRASSTKQTASEINSYISSLDTDADPRAILGALNQMQFALHNQAYTIKSYNEFKSKIHAGDPSVAGQTMDNFYPWFISNKYDLKTGQPLDKSIFQDFDPSGVKGIGPGGEAAGGLPSTTPTTPGKKSLKDIFGG